jgi:hypothetical protein
VWRCASECVEGGALTSARLPPPGSCRGSSSKGSAASAALRIADAYDYAASAPNIKPHAICRHGTLLVILSVAAALHALPSARPLLIRLAALNSSAAVQNAYRHRVPSRQCLGEADVPPLLAASLRRHWPSFGREVCLLSYTANFTVRPWVHSKWEAALLWGRCALFPSPSALPACIALIRGHTSQRC